MKERERGCLGGGERRGRNFMRYISGYAVVD
jgi:hypothetical protein